MFINHKVDLKRNITFLKIYRSLNFTLISVNNEFSSWLVRINVVMHAYMQSVSSFVYIIVYIASIARTCLSWTFHLNYSKYYIIFFSSYYKQSNFIKNLVLIRRILTKLSRFDFIKLSFSSYVSNQNLNVQKQNAHDTQKKNNMILQEKEESAVWVEL